MTRQILIFLTFFTICINSLSSQFGGEQTFQFLYLSPSAAITGAGENAVAHTGLDPTYAWFNPAALNEEMSHQSVSFNHQFLFQDVQNGYASYAHHIKKWNTTLHGGFKYVNYGIFKEADEIGNVLGEFTANEIAMVIGGSYQANERIRVGANMKFIGSYLGGYNASGMAFDVGTQYTDPDKKLVVGLAIQNMGFQLDSYMPDRREKIPVNLVAGFTKQLAHVPFRFGVMAHSLHNADMRYVSPFNNVNNVIGETSNETSGINKFVDNLFRHLVISGELLLGEKENFNLRVAYNHLRKRELQVMDFRSLTGFSAGVGLRMKRLKFDYAYSVYHIAGGTHHLGISTNIQYFKGKNPFRN